MISRWRASCPLFVQGVITTRFLVMAALASAASFVLFGIVSAMIPTPIFGRQIPPEPFAFVVWVVSAPLMGLVLATYLVPPPAIPVALPDVPPIAGIAPAGAPASPERASLLGYAGSFAAFLAIGCPVCNKVALVLLGSSGALSIWAPLQPVIGAASLILLAVTLAWRMRMRARGNACPVA